MWSLGVLLYALICGCLPYEGDDLHALYKQILAAKYEKLKYISPGRPDSSLPHTTQGSFEEGGGGEVRVISHINGVHMC